MAYVTPANRSTGDLVTAAIWNQDVVENVKQTAVGLASARGDIFRASAAGVIERVAVGTDGQVLTSDGTDPVWGSVSIGTVLGTILDGAGGITRHRIAVQSGGPNSGFSPGIGDEIGIGWRHSASGGNLQGQSTGAWFVNGVAASGEYCGVEGPQIAAGGDFDYWAYVQPASNAGQTCIFGLSNGVTFADTSELIAFRISGTGNIIGVCDASGVETTRDTGVVPDGTTWHSLHIRRRGSTVQFFRNGAQVGADVTTNVSAATLYGQCGLRMDSAAATSMRFRETVIVGQGE